MKSAEIREAFLNFFAKNGHEVVSSSSLIPNNDPTLLFTNAGMVQFKDVFLGSDKRSYQRAATSQRCVRAGGKHNDLENVGYTARHHTFFEMLGNFSFGDYFKREAINYAWQFLTSKDWLAIPEEKLTITVYADDDEAYNIWHNDVGVAAEKIIRIGDNKGGRYQSDNFWSMGDTGPCGPCTEIFYDHGEDIWGGVPGSPEEDGDRYIEIWNVVFMQFNRAGDGTMTPLPKPSVDTGMGLERISAVMQEVHNNYDIDLFQRLLGAAAKVVGTPDTASQSLRVIADHIRSCAFLIADGVMPANEGRGYVLRRIIRRAVRHGHKLGCQQVFFYRLLEALVKEMGEAYPELVRQRQHIEKVLLAEEEQFAKTLEKGLVVLEEALAQLKTKELPGELIFLLHDTYGFPTDLTNDIARERGLRLDMDGYEEQMQQQRARARAAGKFVAELPVVQLQAQSTMFTGYQALSSKGDVLALFNGVDAVACLETGDHGVIVLSQTPFYAESGGQVGDRGELVLGDNCFRVMDCQKQGDFFLHIGQVVAGRFNLADHVDATVVAQERQATAANHSATHLLHAALREILGEHVVQKGSLVDADKLRFDFSHFESLTHEQLQQLEDRVNQQIRANTAVEVEECSMEDAQSKGAMMLFGEKYGENVRVLSMGEGFSVELCGGTHVSRTGDIGVFHIIAEASIASGIRRIEALTGQKALAYTAILKDSIKQIAELTKSHGDMVVQKVEQLISLNKDQEKRLAVLQGKLARANVQSLLAGLERINGVDVLVKHIEGVDNKTLREMADALKERLDNGAFLLVGTLDGKVSLICGVAKALTARFHAGNLMKEIAPIVGGKGGGRPDMAQGGGVDIDAVGAVLTCAKQWFETC